MIGNKLYYTCAGRHSKNRLARQRAALELLQTVLDAHAVPDVDFVLGISDRPRFRGDGVARAAAVAFAYVATAAHHSAAPSVRSRRGAGDSSTTAALARRRRRSRPGGSARCGAARQPRATRRRAAAAGRRTARSSRAPRCSTPPAAARQRSTSASPRRTTTACAPFRASPGLPRRRGSRYAYLLHVDGNGFGLPRGAAHARRRDSPSSSRCSTRGTTRCSSRAPTTRPSR